MPQDKPKIALVGNTLSKGGAERVQARLSFFFEANGIEVHHILVTNEITYAYAGTVFNMGLLKSNSNHALNKLKRLRKLKQYLQKEQFTYIIDFRVKRNWFQEFIIAHWLYTAPYIMSIRSFNTQYYFPNDIKKARKIFKKSYGIHTVSKALQSKIENKYGYNNVRTIYNPLQLEELKTLGQESINITFPYILGIGRMQSGIKQFDHLIKAYANSAATSQHIRLVLIGDGEDKEMYQTLVSDLALSEWVHFIPFTTNPHPYFANAYATVLTSKFEGFPNVLIESLAQGTPVVSYNCTSGPNEIINHEQNGLLVENQNVQALIKALNQLFTDSELYNACKRNASPSVEKFEMETIGKQWLEFLRL